MLFVTIGTLEEMDACEDALEWFAKTYPGGVEVTREVLENVPVPSWVVWFVSRFDADKRLAWRFVNVAFRKAAEVNPSLARWVGVVGPENWQEARAAANFARAAANSMPNARAADNAANAVEIARRYTATHAAAYTAYSANYAATWDEAEQMAIEFMVLDVLSLDRTPKDVL